MSSDSTANTGAIRTHPNWGLRRRRPRDTLRPVLIDHCRDVGSDPDPIGLEPEAPGDVAIDVSVDQGIKGTWN